MRDWQMRCGLRKPDTIDDDRISDEAEMEAKMNEYLHLRKSARDAFELRYKETIHPETNWWELCSRVLARSEVMEKLSESW